MINYLGLYGSCVAGSQEMDGLMRFQNTTYCFFVALVSLLSHSEVFPGEGPNNVDSSKPLPAAAKAWSDAGAQAGWLMEPFVPWSFGGLSDGAFKKGNSVPSGKLPAFEFGHGSQFPPPWERGVLQKLPDPGVPFALDLSMTTVDDEGLKELAHFKSMQVLLLGLAKGVSDRGMKELAALTNLQSLKLNNTSVSDKGLKDLVTLTKLRHLNLHNTKVTDDGVEHLLTLKDLQCLVLSGTKITDRATKTLVKLTKLESLAVGGDGATRRIAITDASLKELARLENLQALDLNESQITDDGLKELAGLKNLLRLNLEHAYVSNAGLKELASHTHLQWLNLRQTEITDAGLKHLSHLKNLRRLSLPLFPKVTKAGIAALQKDLPSCKID
jgi:hypothetical protein